MPSRRPISLAGLAAALAIGAALLVFLLGAVAVAFVRPTVSREPAQNAETLGGLRYAVDNAWILDPHRRLDAKLAAGLPARDRHVPADQLLYAVFLGVGNDTGGARPMASRIALRDTRGREFAPQPIGRSNRYAYRPSVVPAGTQLPAPGTPAERDISADGLLLVFRIPRRSYADGPLQLLLHDPAHPDTVRTVQMS